MANNESDPESPARTWLKVLDPGELPEGRVTAVTCEHTTVCMTHFQGRYAAMDNRCPHQRGPLGEGSIENVLHSSRHAELMNLACKTAILNRGVSHLIFPDEVQTLPADGRKAEGPSGRITPRTIAPPEESLDEAVELLASAKRPVIIVGHGARFHMDAITELAESLDCPVVTTFKGKGLIADDRGRGISSSVVFEAMNRTVPDDAIIAVDVGNNTYSFGRYFECRRHAVLMSGYLGSIGFGFPAALGAWAATQEDDPRFSGRAVVSISGDGGFGQYMAEFTTAVKYDMDITHVLLNNSELGKISKEQRSANWDVWQTSLHNPDFAAFARNCGGLGTRVEKAEDVEGALRDALAHQGPALVEIITDPLLV